ncbi:DUF5694 domain-containing protein [Algoriphagus sp. AGSA1]|uniref:DUF5694 domain-containing protein n=1 Tax=Algoriphagus sp. AGSA1 TaxID=2907213 RepID=UPI001F3E2502|nr:DUF5694 domain-containing protein [Algoriphagus sp. AGSA1]MCE7057689.1 DUF5694 domain-containing protein [Algoriphagus sp. AGSA1]
MRHLGILTGLLLLSSLTFGQVEKKEKIKIALLGSFHFTPSTQDTYSTNALKLTEQKQKEIEEVVLKLAGFNPDQICIEMPVDKQESIDRQYQRYLEGAYELELNEIDLLGFQTAKKLDLPRLTCVNYLGEFNTKPLEEAAKTYDQHHLLEETNQYAQGFVGEMNEMEKSLSVSDNLIYLNSPNTLNKNLRLYTKYYTKVGSGSNYEGTELVAGWYETNLHIYTNILRQVRSTDKAILVIYGQGHIPLLKHFFESNPDFEVVDIKSILE